MQTKALTTAIVLFSVLALTFGSGLLAADVLVGANVAAARQTPLDQIDHSVWDGLLKKYVDDKGMVNYKAWKASSGDAQALDQYLAHLSQSNGKGTKGQQLAFWINAYNAVTVKGILQEYPTTSIRNHTAKLFGYNHLRVELPTSCLDRDCWGCERKGRCPCRAFGAIDLPAS